MLEMWLHINKLMLLLMMMMCARACVCTDILSSIPLMTFVRCDYQRLRWLKSKSGMISIRTLELYSEYILNFSGWISNMIDRKYILLLRKASRMKYLKIE